MMFHWLTRLLKRRELKPVSRMLDVFVDGEPQRSLVVGVMGLSLTVQTSTGEMLVSEHLAVDRDEFWRIWKSYEIVLFLDDGSRFDPTGGSGTL